MAESLRALVLGSGYAGQGHVEALRYSGVEVVGMASRTTEVVSRVAADMGIPYANTNWRQALADLKPDVVSVATPGGAHFEPVMAALEQGCNVLCDKPLAATATDAKRMYLKAREKGVKTAYGASYRYQPHTLLVKGLVAEGAIGEPLEVEGISHFNINPLAPFGWAHRIDSGGGRLNNNFIHKLSMVLHVLNGTITHVCGEARNDMPKAPVVSGVHDFRDWGSLTPNAEDAEKLSWETADADWSYTVMARVTPEAGHAQPVSALFKHGGLQPRFDDDYVAFYGRDAALHVKGVYGQGPTYICKRNGTWEEVPLPSHIADSLPDVLENTHRNWTQLAREFAADLRGEGYSGYQTFKDGWIYQEVIEAVREGKGWVEVPWDIS